MTVDRDTRKNAKRQWKKVGKTANEKGLGDKGVKRIRKKANAKRRLCKGMCYSDPSEVPIEKEWRDDDGSGDEQALAAYDSDVDDNAMRIASNKEATTSGAAADGGAAKSPEKAAAKKPKKKSMKLSTQVQLMDPKAAAESAAPSRAKRTSGATPTALQPFHPLIQAYMASQGHIEPTPIQDQCWPACCAGKDVQGVAEPGSGKTLAYLLPSVVRLQEAGHDPASLPEGPLVLVLAPTRELAMQVAQQCRNLRSVTGYRTACVYGGVPKEQQEKLLSNKPHILVATPGRLLDLLDSGATSLSKVCYVALDEADKMLSLGFQQQLERLHLLLLAGHSTAAGKKQQQAQEGSVQGPRPQVLLFTATMPAEVASAASRWLASPVRVTVSHSAASISRTITQVVQVCAEHKKPAKLLRHLAAVKEAGADMRNPPRVLVFANRIKTVRFLHETVSKEGYRVMMLHGQRSQAERENAMRAFKAGKSQIMIATDVAARGLDIRALPYVVNYDFPSRLETYIHRVGRTGRLAANGHAFSFFTRNLAKLAGPLVSLLSEHDQSVDPNLLQLSEAWKQAVERAGGEAALEAQLKGTKGEDNEDDEGEGEEDDEDELETLLRQRAEAADVTEGLEAVGALSHLLGGKKKKKVKASEADGDAPKSKKAKVDGGAEDGALQPPSMQQRLGKAKAAGVQQAVAKQEEEAAAAKSVPFIASPKFAGRRMGYLFKKGPQGLGYYVDNPPRVAKKSGMAGAAAQKGKGPIIPVERGKHSWSDDSDSDDGAGAPKGGDTKGGNSKKQQTRKKAMPGRLRKKLQAQAAKGK